MRSVPEEVAQHDKIIERGNNPFLLRAILRLKYMQHDLDRVMKMSEALESTGVEKSEFEDAIQFLQREKFVDTHKDSFYFKEGSGTWTYVHEQWLGTYDTWCWLDLDDKTSHELLQKMSPTIKFDIIKEVELGKRAYADLVQSANQDMKKILAKIEDSARKAYSIDKQIPVPISASINIPNPMRIDKKYNSLEEAFNDGAFVRDGIFMLNPAFKFKGNTFETFPLEVRVLTENGREGNVHRIDVGPDVYKIWRLPVSLQQYGGQKSNDFLAQMKPLFPEKSLRYAS